jgi:hypothetical protein
MVKRPAVGLSFFLAGVILCAANWLGAAAAVPAVQEWSGRRINGGWQYVGYTPLIVGLVLLVIGIILIQCQRVSALVPNERRTRGQNVAYSGSRDPRRRLRTQERRTQPSRRVGPTQ